MTTACASPADVKRIVDETRAQYPDATHVVHAAVMGNQFSFSDDHEPKNTAGRPALPADFDVWIGKLDFGELFPAA